MDYEKAYKKLRSMLELEWNATGMRDKPLNETMALMHRGQHIAYEYVLMYMQEVLERGL